MNIATDIITIASVGVPLVVAAIKHTVNLCLLTIHVTTFIAALFGLISSTASTAEETTGFYKISQWWVGLIAWGVGLGLFLVGLAVDGKDRRNRRNRRDRRDGEDREDDAGEGEEGIELDSR